MLLGMNQIQNNPFPYSDTNKRYHTLSYYFKNKYGKKVAKVPLNAGFTCPNRDGFKSTGGCAFCSALGSGDSIADFKGTLSSQYEKGLAIMRRKWPDCLAIPYFQSFTNTYADLNTLIDLYEPFLTNPDILGLSIATRADCLEDSFISWLAQYANTKEIWIELGLQSIHEKTMAGLNRAHKTDIVFEKCKALQEHGIKVCLHLINGLPGEDYSMMMESARAVAKSHADGIKIHMLHVVKNSRLASAYALNPFPLLSEKEYVDLVCDQLEVLPAEMVVERITGDAMADELVAPLWTLNKRQVANDIDKELKKRNSYQGKKCLS